VTDQEAVAELLAPGRATELKRQRQAELAQALAGPPPPRESDGADDASSTSSPTGSRTRSCRSSTSA
jgi:hypothetical protein